MKHTWQHSPGSKQHWLYKGSSLGSSGILGMIYEVGPAAFTVYRENRPQTWQTNSREFIAQMDTLDDAKNLLMTIVGSQTCT